MRCCVTRLEDVGVTLSPRHNGVLFLMVALASAGCAGSDDSTVAAEQGKSGTAGTPGAASPKATGGVGQSGAGGEHTVSAGVGDSGPAYSTSIDLAPPNLSTGHSAALVPTLTAHQSPFPIDRDWVPSGIAISDASGVNVPATGTFDSTAANAAFVYKLVPDSALAEGWYTIRLSPPASFHLVGEVPEGPVGPSRRADGSFDSYFRVGSEPLLLAVAACASTNDGTFPKLILSFSERIHLPDPPPIALTADGSPRTCSVYMSDANPLIGLTCAPALTSVSDVSVSIGEGIVSESTSAALRSVTGGTTMTVSLPAALDGSVCRTWRETVPPSN